ncbi:hypothetical protein HZA97_08195 [Candidatus Woesearchaeota archaeon]|nr:hypothetical protein [Candidatus Woesearchaeota archaeon]
MDIKDYVLNKKSEFAIYDMYDFKKYFKNEAIIAACAYFGGHLLGFQAAATAGLIIGVDAGVRLFTGGLNEPVSGLVGKIREMGSK